MLSPPSTYSWQIPLGICSFHLPPDLYKFLIYFIPVVRLFSYSMAEVIGLASGLLAITLFTLNASSTLYQTAKSIHNYPQTILDLLTELGDFVTVLQNLQKTIEDNGIDLDELKGPLLSSGNACLDLKVAITKCTSHSSGGKTSFRDWTKMKFKGIGIAAFQDLIERYKSTIMVALCGANL